MAERAAVAVLDTRVWSKPHRGPMDDDPLLFMLKDRIHILAGARFLAVLWAAT